MIGALLVGLVLLLLSLGFAGGVEGHAIIMESSPKDGEVLTTPPSRLIIRFNGRIVHALSRVTLLGPDGRPVSAKASTPESPPPPERPPSRLRQLLDLLLFRAARSPDIDRLVIPLPRLGQGRYDVHWQVLAEDGHLTRGGFSFSYAPEEDRP